MVPTKVHVFVTLFTSDLVSFGFTLQFTEWTKDFCLTLVRPVVIFYVSLPLEDIDWFVKKCASVGVLSIQLLYWLTFVYRKKLLNRENQ